MLLKLISWKRVEKVLLNDVTFVQIGAYASDTEIVQSPKICVSLFYQLRNLRYILRNIGVPKGTLNRKNNLALKHRYY